MLRLLINLFGLGVVLYVVYVLYIISYTGVNPFQ
jgi:hypothetical protein